MVDELTLYEGWNLSKPQLITKPSRLFCLEPIGIGTPYIESIVSYTSRLAIAHMVQTGMLIMSEIAPLMKKEYAFDGKHGGLDKIFANQTRALNGTGMWAQSVVHAIEMLTGKSNLSFLTMLPWAQVLPSKGLLKADRAWCPFCFEEWHIKEQEVYEPLLWSLNSVTICPRHDRPLDYMCSYCQRTCQTLAWSSRPGYCPKCHSWLGTSEITSCNMGKLNKDELYKQLWITLNIGELLAVNPDLFVPPSAEQITKKLSRYVEISAKGNIALFAKQLGMNRTQTHRWCTGRTQPTIDILLKFCDRLETSLLQLLIRDSIDYSFLEGMSFNQSAQRIDQNKKSSYKKPSNSEQIEKILKKVLEESPPPSLPEVAKRLGYKGSTALYYHAKELCHAISTRYEKHRKTEVSNQVQQILKQFIETDEYPPPSAHEVCERIGVSWATLIKYPEEKKAIIVKYRSYLKQVSNQRIQLINEEVRKIAFELHSEGLEPTESRVSTRMQKPKAILQKASINALKAVRLELGYES